MRRHKIEAIVVGSDQVWRPCYNPDLADMYLRFARCRRVTKIAYAASFGVGEWEYNEKQGKRACRLIKSFKAVSVRESSGVDLCKKYLKTEAIEVLDPTLLLSSNDYDRLCENISKPQKRHLFAYILDMTPEKRAKVEAIAAHHNLEIKYAQAGTISVEEWIANFRDAESVVTDSFHGVLFSVIYRKPFLVMVNSDRGASRFESILSKLNLLDRAISLDSDTDSITDIDWEMVIPTLKTWQDRSLSFLDNNLSNK